MMKKMNFGAAMSGLVLVMTGCASAPATSGVATPPAASSGTASPEIERRCRWCGRARRWRRGQCWIRGAAECDADAAGERDVRGGERSLFAVGRHVPDAGAISSTVVAFGGSQVDANYAQFAAAIGALYAAYYPKLVTGDAKTAGDLLNAIAGGIEDATASYVGVAKA